MREYAMMLQPQTLRPDRALYRPSGLRLMVFAFPVLFVAVRADAARLAVEFVDPAGDQTAAIGWTSVHLQFDDQTGAYSIRLVTDPSAPFQGDLRANINLVNPDTDVFAVDPSLFSDTLNDISIGTAELIVLTGTSASLIEWDVGDRVGTSHAPFGSPAGAPSEFRSQLLELPTLTVSDELTTTSVEVLALAPAEPVTDPLALMSGAQIDWTELGGPFTPVANPSVVIVDGSLSATVSKASPGDLERRDQCSVGEPFGTCGSNGNFAPGEPLLFTNFTAGPVRVEFSEPVMAVGAQLNSNEFAPYTAVVEAFGPGGASLGFSVQTGVGSSAADDSAAFVGIQMPENAIHAVEFNVAAGRLEFSLNGPQVLRASAVPALSARAVGGLVTALLVLSALLAPRGRAA